MDTLIEIVDPWHPDGLRMSVGLVDGEIPEHVQVMLRSHVPLDPVTRSRPAGRYVRAGNDGDGAPHFEWAAD